MVSFKINMNTLNDTTLRIIESINKNKGYFKFWNSDRYAEAMQEAFYAALKKCKSDVEDIEPYIKKLAQTVLKKKNKETAYETTDPQTGEPSRIFMSLNDTFDIDESAYYSIVKKALSEAYLEDPEYILSLKEILIKDVSLQDAKLLKPKNEVVNNIMVRLMKDVNARAIMSNMMKFFTELENAPEVENKTVKEITIKQANYTCLDQIPDTPTIEHNGKGIKIDKRTLKMADNFNPDLQKWDVTFSNCNVHSIDISEIMNYIYERVYVKEGVNNSVTTWCNDLCKYTSCSGWSPSVNSVTEEKFIDLCFNEIVINLLMNNINTIIATSEETIYIKPTKLIKYSVLRIKTVHKTFDCPISVVKTNKEKTK